VLEHPGEYDSLVYNLPILERRSDHEDLGTVDRMDETLEWLRWLEPDETRLVWLRAEGVGWKPICARFGVGRTTAWHRWNAALGKIAVRLNAAAENSSADGRAHRTT